METTENTPDTVNESEPVIDEPFDVSAFEDKPPPPSPPTAPGPRIREMVPSLRIVHHDHDIVREEALEKDSPCSDLAEHCAGWASSGECAKNPRSCSSAARRAAGCAVIPRRSARTGPDRSTPHHRSGTSC